MEFLGQQRYQSELSLVGVLILVYHYIFIQVLIVVEDVRKLLKKLDCVADHVVEVHSVCGFELLLIVLVYLAYGQITIISCG